MKVSTLPAQHAPPQLFPRQSSVGHQPQTHYRRLAPCCKHAGVLVYSAEIKTSTFTSTMQELPEQPDSTCDTNKMKHLVVMANGLFGKASNWDVVVENLQAVLDISQTLLVASDANSLLQTFDGIDSCGDRLAIEIQQKVEEYPSLEKISLLGHSMGGLLVRYAAGKLYDPSTGLICGLKPAHFVTLATPHMGCDGAGPAQVPFIGWTGDVPLAGHIMQRVLQSVAKPFVAAFMKRTGQQFFMHDTEEGRQPLLVRMSQDSAEDGYFLAALDSFVTRTCYANAGGDHLVGWANSSIRHPNELPVIDPQTKLRGVIREDPLQAALHPQHADAFLRHQAATATDKLQAKAAVSQTDVAAAPVDDAPQHTTTSAAHSPTRLAAADDKDAHVQAGIDMSTAGRTPDQETLIEFSTSNPNDSMWSTDSQADEPKAAMVASPAEEHRPSADASQAGPGQKWHVDEANDGPHADRQSQQQQQQAAEDVVSSSPKALQVLRRLQTLPWRRVDVSFQQSSMPFFAHNHIQVTRKWLNWEGASVCEHLAKQLATMEKDQFIQELIGTSQVNM